MTILDETIKYLELEREEILFGGNKKIDENKLKLIKRLVEKIDAVDINNLDNLVLPGNEVVLEIEDEFGEKEMCNYILTLGYKEGAISFLSPLGAAIFLECVGTIPTYQVQKDGPLMHAKIISKTTILSDETKSNDGFSLTK